jgi:DNA repair exonuclease SbcCD ATPase subunit
MILFEKIRYKNFLSTGNNFTEVDLRSAKSTLVVGQNGAGKSTMLDALAFALFGKPHRNINKPQLVNSINNKNCVVEVEFSVGASKFKVVRGIKPGIFEIWKNGEMINQSSHAKEYQRILETNILKINHKSFHQVVVLGSSSFIPFMQLNPHNRRLVIEDLLDIGVFSKMNQILKEETNAIREKLRSLSYDVDITKNKLDTQNKYISDVKVLTQQNISAKEQSIQQAKTDIENLTESNIELSQKVEKDQGPIEEKLNELHDKKQSFLQYGATFKNQMSQITKEAKFYDDNESCPTCSQDISPDLRQEKLSYAKSKAKELKSAMDRISVESAAVEQAIQRANDALSQIREWQTNIHANNREISRLQGQISSLQDELSNTVEADLQKAQDELIQIKEHLNELNDQKMQLNEQYSYKQALGEMLKDTGIKTKIIKQYLPVMNQLINQYLQVLDFYVHFDLDEEFNETIRSRHRDEFTYDSFSEGEKQRIDLALLFTWRQIAKMKNSVSTNLLVLDETFDSSLDEAGVENLLKILYTLDDNTNVFVISHKGEILDGKFESKIEFKKEKNFSMMAA